MLSGSPLEILFDLAAVGPLWHTMLGLGLLAAVGLLWLYLRRDLMGRRFGGAVAFLAVAFATEIQIPWLPPAWRSAMTLRALSLLAFLFGMVRALVLTADTMARRRGEFSTILRDLATLFVYGLVILV